MVTIAIITGLLLSFVIGFFCATKAIQIGLRWQLQTNSNQQPTFDSPIKTIVDSKQQEKADEITKYSKDQMREWMHGE